MAWDNAVDGLHHILKRLDLTVSASHSNGALGSKADWTSPLGFRRLLGMVKSGFVVYCLLATKYASLSIRENKCEFFLQHNERSEG